MPDNFADFPYGEAHKESPAAVKAATDALTANKKNMLQQFGRLTCPTNTDPAIARAEAHTLLLDSVFGAQIYLNSCPPETHEQHLFHTSSFIELSVRRLRLRLRRCPISVNLKNSDLILKLLLRLLKLLLSFNRTHIYMVDIYTSVR